MKQIVSFNKWTLVAVLFAALLDFAANSGTTSGIVTFREADPKQTGVTWVHDNAMSQQHYLPETEPPGVAIFDYNTDGCMDLLLVNTGDSVFYHPKTPHHHALYRNNCDGTFTDVTEQAGIAANIFAMGVAIGTMTVTVTRTSLSPASRNAFFTITTV